jgi:hypothetical protein
MSMRMRFTIILILACYLVERPHGGGAILHLDAQHLTTFSFSSPIAVFSKSFAAMNLWVPTVSTVGEDETKNPDEVSCDTPLNSN